ncbi:hypothetical protein GCM10025772_28880 [Ferrimonas gelatinilytica]|uniref:Uncharacterized protein n=1 Tax=Ferrimonas gelatinilytica TaxID=1255257 RepID=A0ABP9SHM1_9GAMM
MMQQGLGHLGSLPELDRDSVRIRSHLATAKSLTKNGYILFTQNSARGTNLTCDGAPGSPAGTVLNSAPLMRT